MHVTVKCVPATETGGLFSRLIDFKPQSANQTAVCAKVHPQVLYQSQTCPIIRSSLELLRRFRATTCNEYIFLPLLLKDFEESWSVLVPKMGIN